MGRAIFITFVILAMVAILMAMNILSLPDFPMRDVVIDILTSNNPYIH